MRYGPEALEGGRPQAMLLLIGHASFVFEPIRIGTNSRGFASFVDTLESAYARLSPNTHIIIEP